jgi:glycopeptide antibiotics resistance protein
MTDTVAATGTRTRRLQIALFAVYLVLLAWLVLWRLEIPYVGATARVVKLVPFVAAPGFGASQPGEVLANVLIFIPFGLYLGLLAPRWPWWCAAAVIAGVSVGFEVTQFVLAVGSSDITDVIANTAGGIVGLGLFALARRALRERTDAVITWICSILTLLAVLAAVAFFFSPMHYGPPAVGRLERSLPSPRPNP